ncbi:MAG: hypothetical protein BM557_11680 [Flavobacterium sp. MedPE-SWcel]|uniref:hypothetical protein n=1 Tax=uncultured Flavobacterium sp. TaxID=165435 RepID=UPI00091BCEE2|nr:hypothetical protein [uncultured Flavobacterium sp.]OIQ15322.1 MAG: hypothetical protein BM557_11680 [Flavobacterium sp. MedPE-SWcel]
MKNLFLKSYVILFLLASEFTLYAQSPGDEDGSGPGGVEGDDPVAPINTKLIILAFAAVAFAYYYFSKRSQRNLTSN